MSLNICVDIDGTITDSYAWITYFNEYFNTNVKAEDMIKFDICRITGISEEEYEQFYAIKGNEMHLNAQPREGAAINLSRLSEKNNIYYITARPERFRECTSTWLKENGFPEGEIYMLGSHDKDEKAVELKCDFFVEDRYRNARMIADKGIKVFLIDSNYNRYPLVNNIQRVYGWEEIYLKINA